MFQYFKPEELKCKCDRGDECDAKPIDMAAWLKLEGLRREFNQGMVVTSACRCTYWNSKVGGEENSNHLLGLAFDIQCADGVYMLRLAMMALKHGFRLGVKKRMLHLDVGAGPQVMFGY